MLVKDFIENPDFREYYLLMIERLIENDKYIIDKSALYASYDFLELYLTNEIGHYELRYTNYNFIGYQFRGIILRNATKYYADFIRYYSYVSKELKDDANTMKSSSETKISYTGLDVDNQDGAYNNENNNTTFSRSNLYQFYDYVKRYQKPIADDIIKEILELCFIVYES